MQIIYFITQVVILLYLYICMSVCLYIYIYIYIYVCVYTHWKSNVLSLLTDFISINQKSQWESCVSTGCFKHNSASYEQPVLAVRCYSTLSPKHFQVLEHVWGDTWLYVLFHSKDNQLSFLSPCSTLSGVLHCRHCSSLLWLHLSPRASLQQDSGMFMQVSRKRGILSSGIFQSE